MKYRPKLKLPKTRLEWFLDIVSLAVFVVSIVYILMKWPVIPDLVPGHYDAAGEVDRWGGKWELFILPIIGALLWIFLMILEKFPHVYNYTNVTEENVEAQYQNARLLVNVMKNQILIFFAYMNWKDVQVAIGQAKSLGPAFLPVFLGVIFVSMAFFIIRSIKLNK